MSVGLNLKVGWIEVSVRSTLIQAYTHTNTKEKPEINDAVMKCGPEKGHWVVVRQCEREREN